MTGADFVSILKAQLERYNATLKELRAFDAQLELRPADRHVREMLLHNLETIAVLKRASDLVRNRLRVDEHTDRPLRQRARSRRLT